MSARKRSEQALVLRILAGACVALAGGCVVAPQWEAATPMVAPSQSSVAAAGAQPVVTSNTIREPSRARSHETPPFVVPDVPALLANPPDLTAEVETRNGDGTRVLARRKTVARTAARVHITFGDGAVEWLFVRNPVDGRRVSGSLIDHRRRAIIEYDESELRTEGLARGWADVVGFGVRPEWFARMRPADRSETRAGFSFVENQLPELGGDEIRDVWWSREAAAPLRVSTTERGSVLVLQNLRPSVDQSLLLEPRRRFPGYAVLDVADFREQHHDEPTVGTHDQVR